MLCPNCQGMISENSKFCPICGEKIPATPAVEPESVSAEVPVEEPVEELAAVPVEEPVEVPEEVPQEEPVAFAPQKKKKSGKKLVLGIGIAVIVLLLAAAVVGYFTNWFGLCGPAARIQAAGRKTMKAGSFSIDVVSVMDMGSENDAYTSESKVTMQVSFRPEEKELTLYMTGSVDDGTDPEDPEIELAIYDGQLIVHEYGYYVKYDIHFFVDSLFEAYEETPSNIEDFLYENFGKHIVRLEKEYVDLNELQAALKRTANNWNSQPWLEEYSGLSVSKVGDLTEYRFAPDWKKLALVSLQEFEKVPLDKMYYEELRETLEDPDWDLDGENLEFSIALRDGFLDRITLFYQWPFEYDDDMTEQIDLIFYDIGETEPDQELLEDLLHQAERYYDEYHYESGFDADIFGR